ncbi:response regulator [Noviherbaspirillum saxi]|uniref:Response regulator n=1 Tax=Noviherbaspirillum saxi TaxID=2320863 RepID=A0A3A3FPX3_9BURK|nr:response regulator [Noviherbaspirillum saxi]RJF97244.1 response regulator [Noviherbaspirillum saxi]
MISVLLRILVVEDDQALLAVLCDMLGSLGYCAVGVSCAEDALEQLRSASFHVLLSDINLPGMSGLELAATAVAMAPGISVVFSSGYGYLLTDKLQFEFQLLHKPYHLQELARVLRASIKHLSNAAQ